MKKKSDKLGKFGILGAVLSFLVGYPISSLICSAWSIENYALVAVLYFSVTTAFAWPFMKIGRLLDAKKEQQREQDGDDESLFSRGRSTRKI